MTRLTAAGRLQPVDALELRQRLRAAIASPPRMRDLLLGLNLQFDDYVGIGDEYPEAVQKIVNRANEELWWQRLLAEARRARPTDPMLAAFAEDFDLAPIPVETLAYGSGRIAARDLEARVRAANPLLDVLVWRIELGKVEGRVCRVECPAGTAQGTGFLVGPDIVITNFHVMQRVISGEWKAEQVALRLDYKVLADGAQVSAGKTFKLAKDWLVDYSKYSEFDLKASAVGEPAEDELDYVLLRLDGKPGLEPLLANDPNSIERGWIDVPAEALVPDFTKQKAVYIVQHPDGKPMQIALDTDAIEGIFGNGTRLRYKTNTAPGSSGSPCFGPQWQWIALHHSGDPKYPGPDDPARYNQGILVTAIVRLLEKRGKRSALGRE
jgi:V8-like Glu-specific endopeptidase